MLEINNLLDEILRPLPYRPYCSDDLVDGVRIRPLQTAKNCCYLQINPPSQQYYLVFDVDRQGAAFAWEDCNVAPPNYAAINPKNGHAHLVYKLAEPVATSEHGRLAPLRYLAAVERGYRIELGADAGYSGLITRNPYKSRTLCIHRHEYDLFELSDWLKRDLGDYAEKETAVSGLGRNVTLFDTTRAWAYKAIRFYRVTARSRLFDVWRKEVEDYALGVNAQFMSPLPYSEVKATAKSIAKYCWKHDAEAEGRFSQKQAERGRLGGIAKGLANKEKRDLALLLVTQGVTQKEISIKLGVSDRTIRNWLK